MKLVVLCAQLETQFNELVRIARLLKASKQYSVLFCFYSLTPSRLSRLRGVCRKEGFEYILLDQDEEKLTAQTSTESFEKPFQSMSLKNSIRRKLGLFFPFVDHFSYLWGQIKNFLRLLVIGICQIVWSRKFLLEKEPSIIIVGEDGLGGPSALISLAASFSVPVLVVPYEYSSTTQPIESIVHLHNYRRYYSADNIVNKIVANIFPKWVLSYRGENLLRETISVILSQEILRISPYLPWAVHGGRAKCIAVENEFMFQHYLKQGIPVKKLVITGALYDDVLYYYLQNKDNGNNDAWDKTDSASEKIKILCAIPPDHVADRPFCDFHTYWELIDFWVDNLKKLQAVSVIFQFHPRITNKQIEYITSKGVDVSRDDIAKLITENDILVTSVSSIIRLALASKKVVVNYDVYKFAYPDYDDVEGVITFQEKDEFLLTLQRLTIDKTFSEKIVNFQSKIANKWGILDGNAGKRMLALIKKSLADVN